MRTAAERTRRVDGRLVKFKQETGTGFHLVISSDPQQF